MQVDKWSSEKNASVCIFLFYFIYLFFIKNNLSRLQTFIYTAKLTYNIDITKSFIIGGYCKLNIKNNTIKNKRKYYNICIFLMF